MTMFLWRGGGEGEKEEEEMKSGIGLIAPGTCAHICSYVHTPPSLPFPLLPSAGLKKKRLHTTDHLRSSWYHRYKFQVKVTSNGFPASQTNI